MSYIEQLFYINKFFLLVIPLITEEKTDAKCEVIYQTRRVLSHLV